MEVQIFGVRQSSDTRKALRFFSERRIKTHFVDLKERPASAGELNRFAQKFGVTAMIDRDSRRYMELGLGSSRLSEQHWLDKTTGAKRSKLCMIVERVTLLNNRRDESDAGSRQHDEQRSPPDEPQQSPADDGDGSVPF